MNESSRPLRAVIRWALQRLSALLSALDSESSRSLRAGLGRLFLRLNVLLSAAAVGFFAWNATSYVKSELVGRFHPDFNEWAEIYYQPLEASLFNYVVLCVAMALYGLAFHLRTRRGGVRYLREKSRTLAGRAPLLLIVSAVLFAPLMNRHWPLPTRLVLSSVQLIMLLVPLKSTGTRTSLGAIARAGKVLLPPLTVVLLCAVSIEPLRVMRGPVRLINEFEEIYSDSKWNGAFVDNQVILAAIEEGTVPQAKVDRFAAANRLEYFHQLAGAGPFNHIGHILNPLNEYVSGKAPADVYMQYGQGNTLLFKWGMDLFGGMSVENFYKCYVFYVIYAALYLLLVLQLFGDRVHVFNAFAVYAAAFFAAGYSVFMHAPGVIPTIRLFDTTVFLLVLLYFKRQNPLWLASAIVLATLSTFVNRQFGAVLLIATGAACLPYVWENRRGTARLLLLGMMGALPLAVLAAPFMQTTANTSSTLRYFLLGYLSRRPESGLVYATIVWIAVSYHFLFAIRRRTHPLKYAFIFAFVYAQGLLTYFFWNGQQNHLTPVLPFVGIALLLMLHIWKELDLSGGRWGNALSAARVLVTVGLAVASGVTLIDFYKSKRVHDENFAQHRLYQWDFDRAKIQTTIDPAPFRESVALIRKYSPQDGSGIFLLTVYDGVLPFLAKRFSLMPFFEMQWFLFTPGERAAAIARLEDAKPEYLFVENGLGEVRADPWEPLYRSAGLDDTRRSNRERRLELRKVFEAVEGRYRKVEEGALLSVYRRD